MFWQEDTSDQPFQVPDDIVDLLFSIDCKRLPVDHAYALSTAVREVVPWIEEEPGVAIQAVHVAGSQNGWERPEPGTGQYLIVSHRTKLTIRVPKTRIQDLRDKLGGRTLDVAGCLLTVHEGKTRPLGKDATLYARYVVTRPGDTEDRFLDWAAAELGSRDIRMRKALCGKENLLSVPAGAIHTRSLMLADLSPEESVRLQQIGLGPRREMGCGIFIPHKGIDTVKRSA